MIALSDNQTPVKRPCNRPLKEGGIDDLWRRYRKTGEVSFRNQLAEHYAPMLRRIAGYFYKRWRGMVEYDELVSEGWVGLILAVARFDPTRGLKFEAHANLRITWAMKDGLRKTHNLSRYMRAQFKHDGAPVPSVCCVSQMFSGNNDNKSSPLDDIEGDQAGSLSQNRELIEWISCVLNTREALLMILVYVGGLTLNGTARYLRLSPSRVSQLHISALAELKRRYLSLCH